MAGRWIVQSLPSLINSDTNPPQFFVINSRGRHFSNYEEATAECDKLNAEEEAAEKLWAGVAALRKRLEETRAECQEQADEASKDNDRASYKFHLGMAEGVKLASILLSDVLKPSSVEGPVWISVGERLPQIGTLVLIWTESHVYTAVRFSDRKGRSGQPLWNERDDYGVTHWMELPKGPEA